MTDHAGAEMTEAIAALSLFVAGAGILLLAARDRRSGRARLPPIRPSTTRRAIVGVAAALSLGAAAIHFAAGPEHVEELGDLGLGFYWAAIFQAGWALAYLARPHPTLAWIGIAGNAAIVLAWAWTRTVGLPVGADAGHAEAIGVPDLIATLFQLGLVAILLVGVTSRDRIASRRAAVANGTVAAIPMIGIVFLATTLAVSITIGSGGHHGGHDSDRDPAGSHSAGRVAH